ncbi:MAG TPA: transaldolase family protein [Thermoflexales bacterium]|nr:transaldolase family protein [Thermoflexales bacterium]HQW34656.1 transaldolase family protein [Thermoflexales bacterium]HRA00795.1 transaldolase family protein [Thermoflexales bacterium]
MTTYNSPLQEMALTTPTQYLNDSCSVEELNYAIERGAIGATSNPVIVGNVLKKEMGLWKDRIAQIICDNPTWDEARVAWQVYQEIAVNGAKLLMPVFERTGGKLGRLSIQVDPAQYRNPVAILAQAEYFAGLNPNIQIKIPATSAGISVIEEATYRGINLNVTVSFCVPQVMAIGEAMERGLMRREAAGKDTSTMTPYATMMVGRCDDWMKMMVKKQGTQIDPAYLEWAGVACFKKAYELYQQRGYRTILLSAAYRNFLHWTEFVGGDVALTIPYDWQVKFNQSDIKPIAKMQEPVKAEILNELYTKIPEFRRAYEPDGMSLAEFDTFGATVRTLRSFIEAWHGFVGAIRDFMLPNPDV